MSTSTCSGKRTIGHQSIFSASPTQYGNGQVYRMTLGEADSPTGRDLSHRPAVAFRKMKKKIDDVE
ncbi:hypothetical protein ABZ894_19375 [Nocardia beijingensis]|uniref:hypothetical protein n=1 Tax=Nocardia beijingensis TaxID=95162 RepID=UPI0034081F42